MKRIAGGGDLDVSIKLIISALLGLLVGAVVTYFFNKKVNDSKVTGAKFTAEQIVEEAKREADALKKEALLEAKDETHKLRIEAESEIRERRAELQKQESRLLQREENHDRKDEALNKRDAGLERKEEALTGRQQHVEQMERKAEELVSVQKTELEKISSLTRDEAKRLILSEVEKELATDIAVMTKEQSNEQKRNRIKSHVKSFLSHCNVLQQTMLLKQLYR